MCSYLHCCVMCHRLKGKPAEKKMADVPLKRLETSPPFSYVGLDVFGPWLVVTKYTRGDSAQSKRWAILFTCMTTRGVQREVVESMDTTSYVKALTIFFIVRGPAKQLRSDRGINLIANSAELGMELPSFTCFSHFWSVGTYDWSYM